MTTVATGPHTSEESERHVVEATRRWLERTVVGLGLCPFAAGPYRHDLIRYRVSAARDTDGLTEDLAEELCYLAGVDPLVCETSLLIHPCVLEDFHDYNRFLDRADTAVAVLGLTGTLQVASFHPAYQFAGTTTDDMGNFSNRSPHPMLHLLREASVERAAATYAGVHDIGDRNIAKLRALGNAGWQRLVGSE